MARHELTEKLDEIARGGLSVRSAHVRLNPRTSRPAEIAPWWRRRPIS